MHDHPGIRQEAAAAIVRIGEAASVLRRGETDPLALVIALTEMRDASSFVRLDLEAAAEGSEDEVYTALRVALKQIENGADAIVYAWTGSRGYPVDGWVEAVTASLLRFESVMERLEAV